MYVITEPLFLSEALDFHNNRTVIMSCWQVLIVTFILWNTHVKYNSKVILRNNNLVTVLKEDELKGTVKTLLVLI
jgi:hypothetical protein